MMVDSFSIPVVLFVFRKLDTVKLIFKVLEEVKPAVLYIFSDGPRENKIEEARLVNEVRKYIRSAITWQCDTHFEFSQKNKGCVNNICQGLDYVFGREPYAVVFEDDVVPMREFFDYSEYLLKKYQNEKQVHFIAGFNAIGDTEIISESYVFSKSAPLSGAFATWTDRWTGCDMKMTNWPENREKRRFRECFYSRELYNMYCKVFDEAYNGVGDGWDYQFHHDMLDKDACAIVPRGNLAKNHIDAEGALHPQKKDEAIKLLRLMDYTKHTYSFPLHEPQRIQVNCEYDKQRQKLYLEVRGNYIERHLRYVYQGIKDLAYKYMPRRIWNNLKKICSKVL